jgi:hypothetical protein
MSIGRKRAGTPLGPRAAKRQKNAKRLSIVEEAPEEVRFGLKEAN